MIEIRIHGRGGQGSVVTAELLAIAAFNSGLHSQAFPYLGGGGERRGAPVQAFCRIDKSPIQLKCQIMEPDYLIVQDDTLFDIVNIFEGLKTGGLVIINSEKKPEEFNSENGKYLVHTFPATAIALEVLKQPLSNTVILGAFAAITGLLTLESLKAAVQSKFSGSVSAGNILAMEKAYQQIRKVKGAQSDET